jgi:multimeric flavodoxin WrbA
MKIVAINASARKNGNSAEMLRHAIKGAESEGAEVTPVHLYDLNYKGCTGCVSCKLLGGKSFGRCAQRDDLTPVLEAAVEADALLLSTPVYWDDVTGMLRSFLERFWFPTFTYSKSGKLAYPKRIRVGMIFTTNAPSEFYKDFYRGMKEKMEWLIGETEFVCAEKTWQFEDYSKYASEWFDVEERKRQRREVFPEECKRAYEMGKRIAAAGKI